MYVQNTVVLRRGLSSKSHVALYLGLVFQVNSRWTRSNGSKIHIFKKIHEAVG